MVIFTEDELERFCIDPHNAGLLADYVNGRLKKAEEEKKELFSEFQNNTIWTSYKTPSSKYSARLSSVREINGA